MYCNSPICVYIYIILSIKGEDDGASVEDSDQENDEEAGPPKRARTGGSRLHAMYQQILEENEVIGQVTGDATAEVNY